MGQEQGGALEITERSERSQGAEEPDDSPDSSAVFGELSDVEAIRQGRPIRLEHVPGKASESVVDVDGARTHHSGAWPTGENAFDVSEELITSRRVNAWISIRRVVGPDLGEQLGPTRGARFAPHGAVAIDQLGDGIRRLTPMRCH